MTGITRCQYNGNQKEFEEDDARDTGRDSPKTGQRVADCFAEADVVIPNNDQIEALGNEDFKAYDGRVGEYVSLLLNPLAHQRPIRQQEAIMATAYAVSQQSSCLKRKVGAVIVDGAGNIIASGFNEVPSYGRPLEGLHGKCFRDVAWEEFFPQLKTDPSGSGSSTGRGKTRMALPLELLGLTATDVRDGVNTAAQTPSGGGGMPSCEAVPKVRSTGNRYW